MDENDDNVDDEICLHELNLPVILVDSQGLHVSEKSCNSMKIFSNPDIDTSNSSQMFCEVLTSSKNVINSDDENTLLHRGTIQMLDLFLSTPTHHSSDDNDFSKLNGVSS